MGKIQEGKYRKYSVSVSLSRWTGKLFSHGRIVGNPIEENTILLAKNFHRVCESSFYFRKTFSPSFLLQFILWLY